MSPRDAARWLLLAPKRFLDWVYAPGGPVAPTRSQVMAHLHASGAGHDSSRWMQIEEDERRQREQDLRRIQHG
jgi:hypothetical protein